MIIWRKQHTVRYMLFNSNNKRGRIMKTKCRHRWLALFIVFAMLIGTLPITASAEGHTHTEDCYAKAGDLFCTIPESEGHIHTEACVCPGGENICGLEETEGHTHDGAYT